MRVVGDRDHPGAWLSADRPLQNWLKVSFFICPACCVLPHAVGLLLAGCCLLAAGFALHSFCYLSRIGLIVVYGGYGQRRVFRVRDGRQSVICQVCRIEIVWRVVLVGLRCVILRALLDQFTGIIQINRPVLTILLRLKIKTSERLFYFG